jgi:hypothetical protein
MTDHKKARQYSDQMHCSHCGKQWDVNDPKPPQCLPVTLKVKTNHLFYHLLVRFDSIVCESDKSYRLSKSGVRFWVPKSICRSENFIDNNMYIHKKTLEKILARSFCDITLGELKAKVTLTPQQQISKLRKVIS